MKKAVLIVNPSSGNEEAKKYAGQAREKLEQFFYDGDDRNIIDRYCQGKQLPKPFPEVERVKKG